MSTIKEDIEKWGKGLTIESEDPKSAEKPKEKTKAEKDAEQAEIESEIKAWGKNQ